MNNISFGMKDVVMLVIEFNSSDLDSFDSGLFVWENVEKGVNVVKNKVKDWFFKVKSFFGNQ